MSAYLDPQVIASRVRVRPAELSADVRRYAAADLCVVDVLGRRALLVIVGTDGRVRVARAWTVDAGSDAAFYKLVQAPLVDWSVDTVRTLSRPSGNDRASALAQSLVLTTFRPAIAEDPLACFEVLRELIEDSVLPLELAPLVADDLCKLVRGSMRVEGGCGFAPMLAAACAHTCRGLFRDHHAGLNRLRQKIEDDAREEMWRNPK